MYLNHVQGGEGDSCRLGTAVTWQKMRQIKNLTVFLIAVLMLIAQKNIVCIAGK